MKYTYDITVRCNSKEDRDMVLEMIDKGTLDTYFDTETLIDKGIVKYKDSNVFFSESENGSTVRYSEAEIN
jgi:hypothetical protein